MGVMAMRSTYAMKGMWGARFAPVAVDHGPPCAIRYRHFGPQRIDVDARSVHNQTSRLALQERLHSDNQLSLLHQIDLMVGALDVC